jgi:hypothetical protein
MAGLRSERNSHDICVFNKRSERCTATVHADDLLITSVDERMIEGLAEGLRGKYLPPRDFSSSEPTHPSMPSRGKRSSTRS